MTASNIPFDTWFRCCRRSFDVVWAAVAFHTRAEDHCAKSLSSCRGCRRPAQTHTTHLLHHFPRHPRLAGSKITTCLCSILSISFDRNQQFYANSTLFLQGVVIYSLSLCLYRVFRLEVCRWTKSQISQSASLLLGYRVLLQFVQIWCQRNLCSAWVGHQENASWEGWDA